MREFDELIRERAVELYNENKFYFNYLEALGLDWYEAVNKVCEVSFLSPDDRDVLIANEEYLRKYDSEQLLKEYNRKETIKIVNGE